MSETYRGRETYEGRRVLVDPDISFGRPSVAGIATQVLASRFLSGDSIAELAEDYGISERAVQSALRFELRKAKRRKPVTP